MSKTKVQKKQLLTKYQELLKEKPNYILVNTAKVGTTQIDELKKLLKEGQHKFMIIKNTLFKIAAQETEQPTVLQELTEQAGIIVCGDDPTTAAKALKEMQKKHNTMETRYGILFGNVEDASKINQLAEIPSREVLLAQMMGSMQSPLSGFARVINGTVRNLVYALAEVQKKKSSSAAPAQAV